LRLATSFSSASMRWPRAASTAASAGLAASPEADAADASKPASYYVRAVLA
jgi:hypothetical protein